MRLHEARLKQKGYHYQVIQTITGDWVIIKLKGV